MSNSDYDPEKSETIPSIAVVVATKGRSAEVHQLLVSLSRQTRKVAEIHIVDQNGDDRLDPILSEFGDLPIIHHRSAHLRGVNRNRNYGWQQCRSDLVIFADDDCWYPTDFFEKALRTLVETGADAVSGRPADETGQTINGTFLESACWVDRRSVWWTQIEWCLLLPRAALISVDGLDNQIGPGAETPWGAHEVQDLSLRVMAAGYTEYYDPDLIAHHLEVDMSQGSEGYRRVPQYARGFGYVHAKHGYGFWVILKYTLRNLAGTVRWALRLNPEKSCLSLTYAVNRMRGYFQYFRTGMGKKSGSA